MGSLNANIVQLHEFQNEVVTLLSSSFNIAGTVSYLVDESCKPLCYETYNIATMMHREYTENFYKLDPLHPTNFQHKLDRVVRMSDLVPRAQQADNTYYSDFVRQWDVRDIIELFYYQDGVMIGGSSLFFNKNSEELNKNELARLVGLQRYIEFTLNKQLQNNTKISYEDFCLQYGLTNKEKIILQLAIQGLQNKTIASNLKSSLPTVKTHLQHLFSKLQVSSKIELVNKVYGANCIL
ncbi:LuxR C-terminal-related transcriptional regulator [uncultured Psychromonas sp.]|uniref:response regulator transcription factor n=1 Tax=uncultured Psychromonas sp. TaxID=173974 RepID=UPI002619BE7E|nr:LuxR C-terminal-related transcriptional regulator [uncultured Psychromonas sp.]